LVDRDEPRFAEASREMIERGDYIVPYFNNQFRFDKPPLAYWAQVASFKIFGESDFAARLPSAIAAALVAMSIFGWGQRIADARLGFWAAIIFTLSLQTFLHAKGAVADMWLVLFVTIAHWAGFELIENRKTWWWIFYFSLALGFLAKGPIAWTPLLTIAAIRFFQRDLQIARQFKFGRGILLVLVVVAAWGIPALVRTNGEFFTVGIGRHVIARSFGAMEGHGSNSLGVYLLLLPFYFVTVFASFFPWSIKLPGLARRIWANRDCLDTYLIIGAAIIFVIFSLVKTKLPHYTLPAFPLLALLLTRHFSDSEKIFRRCAIAAFAIYLAIASIVPPLVSSSFPAWSIFEQSRSELRPDMEFGAVDYQEPSLVWYFRSRVKGFLTPLNKKNAADFMTKDGPRFVVLPAPLVAQLFPTLPTDWKTFSTHGFNIAKGKDVDLTLVLKPK
jgi:4-amino-4-deoxy-L-arabinose transferase-like glycosyltransferase